MTPEPESCVSGPGSPSKPVYRAAAGEILPRMAAVVSVILGTGLLACLVIYGGAIRPALRTDSLAVHGVRVEALVTDSVWHRSGCHGPGYDLTFRWTTVTGQPVSAQTTCTWIAKQTGDSLTVTYDRGDPNSWVIGTEAPRRVSTRRLVAECLAGVAAACLFTLITIFSLRRPRRPHAG